ncbi:MAG TPA: ATP-binding protein [Gemmatimonadaceae bacterium]|nr:ATP-binding protein [Gemmatimonadaceae bacterium]
MRRLPFDPVAPLLPLPSLLEAVLHLLDDGIAVLGKDGRIVFANEEMERALCLEGTALVGAIGSEALVEFFPDASSLRPNKHAAGVPARRVERMTAAGPRVYEVSVEGLAQGALVVRAKDISSRVEAERLARSQLAENESFRVVACLMAEERDVRQVLELLSAQAAAQCEGDGATVIQIEGERGRAVASVGLLTPLRGREFLMGGSLAESVIRNRTSVAITDFLTQYPDHPWSDAAREVGAGPVVLAPLFAHDSLMGIVTVVRERGREAFADPEIRRIRALADQAALALWKSRLLDEAEAANQAKDEFIAVISHELRTPLAAVAGYEELLAEEILGPLNEEQHNAVDRMRWSTKLLTSIIEEILTFSRLETGEVHLNAESTSVRALLSSAGAVVEPLATARGLAFSINAPNEKIPLTTDADVVRRVLVNLGSNAAKFTQRGGVELNGMRVGSRVCLAVRDSGIGIAEVDLRRIFDAFTQVHTGTARPYGGTGLGLHTAHRLARLVGGELTVESTPDRGSTFSLLLPLTLPAAGLADRGSTQR